MRLLTEELREKVARKLCEQDGYIWDELLPYYKRDPNNKANAVARYLDRANELLPITLKAVGEWIDSRLKKDMSNFTQGFITLGEIESLKRGEMPEEAANERT